MSRPTKASKYFALSEYFAVHSEFKNNARKRATTRTAVKHFFGFSESPSAKFTHNQSLNDIIHQKKSVAETHIDNLIAALNSLGEIEHQNNLENINESTLRATLVIIYENYISLYKILNSKKRELNNKHVYNIGLQWLYELQKKLLWLIVALPYKYENFQQEYQNLFILSAYGEQPKLLIKVANKIASLNESHTRQRITNFISKITIIKKSYSARSVASEPYFLKQVPNFSKFQNILAAETSLLSNEILAKEAQKKLLKSTISLWRVVFFWRYRRDVANYNICCQELAELKAFRAILTNIHTLRAPELTLAMHRNNLSEYGNKLIDGKILSAENLADLKTACLYLCQVEEGRYKESVQQYLEALYKNCWQQFVDGFSHSPNSNRQKLNFLFGCWRSKLIAQSDFAKQKQILFNIIENKLVNFANPIDGLQYIEALSVLAMRQITDLQERDNVISDDEIVKNNKIKFLQWQKLINLTDKLATDYLTEQEIQAAFEALSYIKEPISKIHNKYMLHAAELFIEKITDHAKNLLQSLCWDSEDVFNKNSIKLIWHLELFSEANRKTNPLLQKQYVILVKMINELIYTAKVKQDLETSNRIIARIEQYWPNYQLEDELKLYFNQIKRAQLQAKFSVMQKRVMQEFEKEIAYLATGQEVDSLTSSIQILTKLSIRTDHRLLFGPVLARRYHDFKIKLAEQRVFAQTILDQSLANSPTLINTQAGFDIHIDQQIMKKWFDKIMAESFAKIALPAKASLIRISDGLFRTEFDAIFHQKEDKPFEHGLFAFRMFVLLELLAQFPESLILQKQIAEFIETLRYNQQTSKGFNLQVIGNMTYAALVEFYAHTQTVDIILPMTSDTHSSTIVNNLAKLEDSISQAKQRAPLKELFLLQVQEFVINDFNHLTHGQISSEKRPAFLVKLNDRLQFLLPEFKKSKEEYDNALLLLIDELKPFVNRAIIATTTNLTQRSYDSIELGLGIKFLGELSTTEQVRLTPCLQRLLTDLQDLLAIYEKQILIDAKQAEDKLVMVSLLKETIANVEAKNNFNEALAVCDYKILSQLQYNQATFLAWQLNDNLRMVKAAFDQKPSLVENASEQVKAAARILMNKDKQLQALYESLLSIKAQLELLYQEKLAGGDNKILLFDIDKLEKQRDSFNQKYQQRIKQWQAAFKDAESISGSISALVVNQYEKQKSTPSLLITAIKAWLGCKNSTLSLLGRVNPLLTDIVTLNKPENPYVAVKGIYAQQADLAKLRFRLEYANRQQEVLEILANLPQAVLNQMQKNDLRLFTLIQRIRFYNPDIFIKQLRSIVNSAEEYFGKDKLTIYAGLNADNKSLLAELIGEPNDDLGKSFSVLTTVVAPTQTVVIPEIGIQHGLF